MVRVGLDRPACIRNGQLVLTILVVQAGATIQGRGIVGEDLQGPIDVSERFVAVALVFV